MMLWHLAAMPKRSPNLPLGKNEATQVGSIQTFKWSSIDIIFTPKWFRAYWRICSYIQPGAQKLNSRKTFDNFLQFNLSSPGVSGTSPQVGWPLSLRLFVCLSVKINIAFHHNSNPRTITVLIRFKVEGGCPPSTFLLAWYDLSYRAHWRITAQNIQQCWSRCVCWSSLSAESNMPCSRVTSAFL